MNLALIAGKSSFQWPPDMTIIQACLQRYGNEVVVPMNAHNLQQEGREEPSA